VAGFGLAVVVVWTTACGGPPVGVKRVGLRSALADATTSAISTGEPSADTRGVLWRLGLARAWEKTPRHTLQRLHALAMAPGAQDEVFALAELSYITAEREAAKRTTKDARALYLSAATYAYFYLVGADDGTRTAFDSRFRLACELYNRGLARALTSSDGEVKLEPGARRLFVGELQIVIGRQDFIGARRLRKLLPAEEFVVRGLANRHRASGLGVPLIGVFGDDDGDRADADRVAERAAIPLTVLLRIDGTMAELATGPVPAQLEVLWPTASPIVEVGPHAVPLETDLSAPLAYHLQESGLFAVELKAFLGRDELPFDPGLYLLEPYQPGKVPVVLVHGTASSPGRWADLVNELYAEPLIRSHYQFWMYVYPSGNFIPASALQLRDGLREIRRALDPDGTDEALDRMVLVGHSQGGLLVQMQVTRSTEASAAGFLGRSVRSDDFTSHQSAFLRRTLVFEPAPFVARAVFVCTPHRGSVLAESFVGRMIGRFVRLPRRLLDPLDTLSDFDDTVRAIAARLKLVDWDADHVPTAMTGMTPGSPFLEYLDGLPFAPDVDLHSIVAVKEPGPLATATDGVVAYSSAHLAGARSEKVVVSGHSAQGDPEVIAEMRRILLEHCAEWDPACGESAVVPMPGTASPEGPAGELPLPETGPVE
jgi:pimeloyl-ACP methyl ester carboxylesterase